MGSGEEKVPPKLLVSTDSFWVETYKLVQALDVDAWEIGPAWQYAESAPKAQNEPLELLAPEHAWTVTEVGRKGMLLRRSVTYGPWQQVFLKE